MPIPILTPPKCNYCSRHKSDFLPLSCGAIMCWDCWDHHVKTLRMLGGGKPVEECQICRTPITEMMHEHNLSEVSMFIVPKDGVLATACRECAASYLNKRADLFRGTEASKKGVIGG